MANCVTMKLDGSDTYTVTFYRIGRGLTHVPEAVASNRELSFESLFQEP
jgi:hypothetical protein